MADLEMGDGASSQPKAQDVEMESDEEPTNQNADPNIPQLPQKKKYRQRAHSNPMSDHDVLYPRQPGGMAWDDQFVNYSHLQEVTVADVGCGFGGMLMALAGLFPDEFMVGFELRVQVSNFVKDKINVLRVRSKMIPEEKVQGDYGNVACLRTNAMKFIPCYFRKGELKKMFILFPDPHFKKQKHKWRIVSQGLLTEYAFVMRPGGLLYTISDVKEVHDWIVMHCEKHPLWERLTEEELSDDLCYPLLSKVTEEGQKGYHSLAGMEDDPYESLPTHSVGVHLAAGAAAGIIEHTVMFPFDSVKTRLQSLCPCPEAKCPTPVHSLWSIIKREGWLRPLRGMNAVALGAGPAHALYFTVYEKTKGFLTNNTAGHHNTWAYGASGVVATLVHDAVMNPAEVVKQRMQMQFSPYGGSLECARCIYRREGLVAFYRSYTTQLAMNVPFQTVNFVTYEFWQQVLNPSHAYDPLSHAIAGGMAGGLAAAVTTPMDCIKTVLNTQQRPEMSSESRSVLLKASAGYRGISEAARSIYSIRGFGGFTCGLQARILFQAPATGLSWSVYELFKFMLGFSDGHSS